MPETIIDFEEIDRLFNPRAIAIVGASDKEGNQGKMFLHSNAQGGFGGKIYVVNPNGGVNGYDSYSKVSEIPGPVDHLVLTVPAAVVAGVIRDAGGKGVRSAAMFASGFSEWGTEEGARLEEELIKTGRQTGVRLIGPNCMGFYCPKTGLSFRPDFPRLDGPVGIIAQSGGVAISSIYMSADRGLGVSKAISYGNESDLGPPEFLDYLSLDPDTEIILLYIEGTRRGRKLFAAMKRAAAIKPVYALKGGLTPAGGRAAASHTGVMAGSEEMWQTMVRQAGARMAYDLDELIDLAQLTRTTATPKGKNVGLLTVSGGFGVFATDVIARAGFDMPEFSPETKTALKKVFNLPGTSVNNPLDMAAAFFRPRHYPGVAKALAGDDGIDVYVLLLAIDYLTMRREEGKPIARLLVDKLLKAFKDFDKPLVTVFFRTGWNELRLELERKIIGEGFAVFPTVERCMKAIDGMMDAKKRSQT